MGKLAERLSDIARSGVYRIETLEALQEAAALNSYPLVHIVLERVATKSGLLDAVMRSAAFPDGLRKNRDALPGLLSDLSWMPAPGYVLLISGFDALQRAAPEEFAGFLKVLAAAAAGGRSRGTPFFAVFLDPAGSAPLAPLYNWHRHRT